MIAGKSGKITLGANTVTDITSWSLDVNCDMLDATALGDDWKKTLPGLKDWSASADANWNVATDANGQKALQDAYLNGTSVALKLYVNATNYYSGTAYVTSLSIETPVGGEVSASFELQGSGALTYA